MGRSLLLFLGHLLLVSVIFAFPADETKVADLPPAPIITPEPVECPPSCIPSIKDGVAGCNCDLGIMCSPPKCDDPGCHIVSAGGPCPSCVCDNNTDPNSQDHSEKFGPGPGEIACFPPVCDGPGCKMDYDSGPCGACVCPDSNSQDHSDKFGPGPGEIACFPPVCDGPGCKMDYDSGPCGACVCPDVPKCKCDERYFNHYRVKNCEPVYDETDECHCPKRFNCPDKFLENDTVCYFNGSAYQLGEDIQSSNPCQICSCRRALFGPGVRIDCISVECPTAFRRPQLDAGCYLTYDLGKCCSVGQACDPPEDSNTTAPMCDFEGKTYHVGQMMYSEQDPCLSCVCDENWSGKSSKSCRSFDCMLEKDKHRLQSGCLPIYHESTCCPIEFYCATEDSNEEVVHYSSPTNKTDGGDMCIFGDKKGNVGDVLDIHHPTNCVTCSCQTPPEFTCVQTVCPMPEHSDFESCEAEYTPGVCCPTYHCKPQYAPSIIACDPVDCQEGCSQINVPNGCPMCMCDEVLCSPPKCPSECIIDYNSKPCPSCKCAHTIPLDRPMCGPVKCGPNCFQGISAQGCPMCVCGPLCSPVKCESGCHTVDNNDGQCPYCECDAEESSDSGPKVLCSPVKCPTTCRQVMGNAGCPKCECDPVCSPPRCELGCRPEIIPSKGTCPGCTCDEQSEVQCAPVKCPNHCKEHTLPNSCPVCQCESVLCLPPKCQEGCEVDINVPAGSCPECKCPSGIFLNRLICAPVTCGPQCLKAIGSDGCPMCFCGPLCSPPKCDSGCTIQTNVHEGQCPGCDCPPDKSSTDLASTVMCSPVKCPGDCVEVPGDHGCPSCKCQPMCSPPKCEPGCQAEIAPSSGSCPQCLCGPVSYVMCAPVKCTDGCVEVRGNGPCPSCDCGPLCSPPKCDPGCHAEIVPSSGPCPQCVCDKEIPLCGPVKCGPGCHESVSPQGCPTCVCGPLCSPPRCDPGCHIQKNVPIGQCPGCECDPSGPPGSDKVMVSPQSVPCPKECTQIMDDGVLSCRCGLGIACSPPKCDPGCRIESVGGPCPQCVCDFKGTEVICPNVPCMLPCQLVKLTENSCPICQCVQISNSGVRRPTL